MLDTETSGMQLLDERKKQMFLVSLSAGIGTRRQTWQVVERQKKRQNRNGKRTNSKAKLKKALDGAGETSLQRYNC